MNESYRIVGHWNRNIDAPVIVEIQGRYYALDGWDGDAFRHCWECFSLSDRMDDKVYTITPDYDNDKITGYRVSEN